MWTLVFGCSSTGEVRIGSSGYYFLTFLPYLVFTEEVQIAIPIMKPTLEKVQLAGQALPPGFPAPFLFADGLSSVETLLTNIQVKYSSGLVSPFRFARRSEVMKVDEAVFCMPRKNGLPLVYTLIQKTELLSGWLDCSVKCYFWGWGEIVSTLPSFPHDRWSKWKGGPNRATR